MVTQADGIALSLKNVTKSFGSFKAVDGIDIEVRRGEIFGFLGPNGSGKSTTIRLILDILRPSSGTITIFGQPHYQTAATHRKIGYLSGDMTLDDDLTGNQYLNFIDAQYGRKDGSDIHRLAELLEADLSKRIGSYSRGNRQKIGLIAALIGNPELLILDEPTSGFDPLVQEKFADIIRDFTAKGGTVFMSSHVLAEVQHLCDRVAFIKAGSITTIRSVDELLNTQAKRIEVTASQKDIALMLASGKKLPGLTAVSSMKNKAAFTYVGDITPLLRFFAGQKITDISVREPELEEIFGHYYKTDRDDHE